MATNISNLPQTGYTSTYVQRITKAAVQAIATEPLLVRFLQNDASFNSQLTQNFDRGDVANIVIAPTLTATRSTNANDTVTYQTAAFTSVQVTLDNISYSAFKYRDIDQTMSDVDIRTNLEDSAAKALVRDMYGNVVSKFVNDVLIPSDQRIGTNGTTMNYAALKRIRTTAEVQYGISRDTRITVILNPYAYEALQADTAFQTQISNDTSTIATGIIAPVLNMEIYSDPVFSNNGGSSMSISGSAGYVGVAFIDQSGVLITRQIPVSDPTRQFRASYQGVSALYTKTPDSQYVGGMMIQDKLEVLYGFKALPTVRWSDSATHTKIWPILGGL